MIDKHVRLTAKGGGSKAMAFSIDVEAAIEQGVDDVMTTANHVIEQGCHAMTTIEDGAVVDIHMSHSQDCYLRDCKQCLNCSTHQPPSKAITLRLGTNTCK